MERERLKTEKFERLCERLGYRFKNQALLEEAFRHSSYVNETGVPNLRDNERLEFLGDAVLGLVMGDILMGLESDAPEGELSRLRSLIVSERGLSAMARRLDLGECLYLGRGEETSNGREKPSILADTMESLVGALYLDAGYDRTMEILVRLFWPMIEEVRSRRPVRDYKSLLQEYTQGVLKTLPQYRLIEEKGPPHERTFKVVVMINSEKVGEGLGRTKKEAEQEAAKEAFFCLKAKEKDS